MSEPTPHAATVEDDTEPLAPPVLEVRGLRSQFGDNIIHDNLNLAVRRGEVLGVVGGSGTGKSVLLNTIIGLKRPSAGEVRVFGQNIEPRLAPALDRHRAAVGRALPAGRPSSPT